MCKSKFSIYLRLAMIFVLLFTAVVLQPGGTVQASLPARQASRSGEQTPPRLSAPQSPNHSGSGPVAPPPADDSHFVADTGGYLDQYLYRQDVPGGRLTFDIQLGRYYSHWINPSAVDANGFLKPATLQNLLNNHLLPSQATLTLEVYDVDHENTSCAEIDHVYVNGKQVMNPNGGPANLTSGDSTWSTWSVSVPIEYLKFPTAKGANGNPPAAVANQVAVDINTLICHYDDPYQEWWAVEVDWGSLYIPSPIRPLVFAHGWTGTGAGDSSPSFQTFYNSAQNDGIPSALPVQLERGIRTLPYTASLLINKDYGLKKTAAEFGVDKVNLLAHSKGGLVSRWATTDAAGNKLVDHLVTFSSPHHGTDWAKDILKYYACRGFTGQEKTDCYNSTNEFSEEGMRKLNYAENCKWDWFSWSYQGCTATSFAQPKSNVLYTSLTGNWGDIDSKSATFPWAADAIPYPNNTNVNRQFSEDHSSILQQQYVYECTINYIDPNVHACNAAMLSEIALAAGAPEVPASTAQPVLNKEGALSGGTQTSVSSTIDSGDKVIFDVVVDSPITFRIQNPNGQTFDSSTTDPNVRYSVENNGTAYHYQFAVTNPMPGAWQNLLNSPTSNTYNLVTSLNSNNQLEYKLDEYTHQPNETVLIESTLAQGGTPTTGATVQLAVTRPNGAVENYNMLDNGSGGDAYPNDGIYTTQINSSTQRGNTGLQFTAAKGNVIRTTYGRLGVADQTAVFQSIASETTGDPNGNGLFDTLNLGVQINVLTTAHFEVTGQLVDKFGYVITTASYSTLSAGVSPLATGLRTVTLSFDGRDIRANGVDGPYTLQNVSITDLSAGSFVVDSVNQAGGTSAYSASQFEGEVLTILGGADFGQDDNGNGRYDWLTVWLDLDVLYPGDYAWNGRLTDQNGVEIAWANGSGMLDNNNLLELNFEGKKIGDSRLDGPYQLRDLSIYQTSGGSASTSFNLAYTTAPYTFKEFEGGEMKNFLAMVRKELSGFDSQFNGSAHGWSGVTGYWSVDSNYFYSDSLSNQSVSAVHDNNFANFTYSAMLLRTGCDYCSTRLIIRGAPYPLDSGNDFYSFIYLQITNGGYVSVWERQTGGNPTALMPWQYYSAVYTGESWNELSVVASGSLLTFYVNGVTIWSGYTNLTSAGQVGLGMWSDQTGDYVVADWATLQASTQALVILSKAPPQVGPAPAGSIDRAP